METSYIGYPVRASVKIESFIISQLHAEETAVNTVRR